MRERTFAPGRALIYLVVSLIAAAWLVPLIVVALNSLRSNEEIVQTSMIGWPGIGLLATISQPGPTFASRRPAPASVPIC